MNGPDTVGLTSLSVRLHPLPYYGAPGAELTDTRTGRTWPVPGSPSQIPVQGSVCGAAQSTGRDEYFPFVAALDGPITTSEYGELTDGRTMALQHSAD